MVALPKPKETEFVVPDAGVYLMEFVAYDEPAPSSFDPDKESIKLKFRIVDEDYEGVELKQTYGWSTHPKSKLYPVLKALNGGADIDFDEADEDGNYPDLDDFLNKRFLGTIDTVTKPRRDNPKETATFANLVAASPVKKKKRTEPETGQTLDQAKKKRVAEQKGDDEDTWDDEED